VSKSLFFLLLLPVAFLAAAVSFHSGGVRLGDSEQSLRNEASANITSLQNDVSRIGAQAGRVPHALLGFWTDVSHQVRILEADVAVDARMAARRISSLIKTT
jgi:hypothetical protein